MVLETTWLWGCVHSTYARFRPFLTHPSPLYAFHTLRLDPSLLYIRNWLTHSPFCHKKSHFLPAIANIARHCWMFPFSQMSAVLNGFVRRSETARIVNNFCKLPSAKGYECYILLLFIPLFSFFYPLYSKNHDNQAKPCSSIELFNDIILQFRSS